MHFASNISLNYRRFFTCDFAGSCMNKIFPSLLPIMSHLRMRQNVKNTGTYRRPVNANNMFLIPVRTISPQNISSRHI